LFLQGNQAFTQASFFGLKIGALAVQAIGTLFIHGEIAFEFLHNGMGLGGRLASLGDTGLYLLAGRVESSGLFVDFLEGELKLLDMVRLLLFDLIGTFAGSMQATPLQAIPGE
jgi:hypothetical protein